MTSILKVDTIQNSSGTSALSIGSGGAIYPKGLTYWPHVFVEKTSTQTSTGSNETITWDVIHTNTGSIFNTSTNKFVAPISGVYFMTMIALSPNNTSQSDLVIYKNGTETMQRTRNPNSGNHESYLMSLAVQLSANDTLEAAILDTGGSIFGSSDNWTTLSIAYLGG